jgi:hypothetical protein
MMKQQVNPTVAILAVVGALAVIGLVVYFMNNRPEPTAPRTTPAAQASGAQTPGAQSSTRNMSPDDVVKTHMNQMQNGGAQK